MKKFMTVKQLKALLSKFDENLPVILQEDPEGNGFRRLVGAYDNAAVKSVLNYMEEVHLHRLDNELKKFGFTEEDVAPKSYHQVVVLCP